MMTAPQPARKQLEITFLSEFCLFVRREGEIAAGSVDEAARFTALAGPVPLEGFPSASATGRLSGIQKNWAFAAPIGLVGSNTTNQ
jgi:hypothetical protein